MEEYVTRFVFYVNVGDLPPKEAAAHVKTLRDEASGKNFFPKDSVLYIPVRQGETRVEAYSFPKSQLY